MLNFEDLVINPQPHTVYTGYKQLNRIIGGIPNSSLFILAGAPGTGKSILALNIIKNVGQASSCASEYFSLEQTPEQLCLRFQALEAEINIDNLLRGKLEDLEVEKFNILKGNRYPLRINCSPRLTLEQFSHNIKKSKEENNLSLVILDDIQRLSLEKERLRHTRTRDEEISVIVRELKSLTLELNISIIAISQLNRNCYRRENKIPLLTDLRDSGAIENEADIVAVLQSSEHFDFTIGNISSDVERFVELYVIKNKNGLSNEKIELSFKPQYCQFKPWQTWGDLKKIVTFGSKVNDPKLINGSTNSEHDNVPF